MIARLFIKASQILDLAVVKQRPTVFSAEWAINQGNLRSVFVLGHQNVSPLEVIMAKFLLMQLPGDISYLVNDDFSP